MTEVYQGFLQWLEEMKIDLPCHKIKEYTKFVNSIDTWNVEGPNLVDMYFFAAYLDEKRYDGE